MVATYKQCAAGDLSLANELLAQPLPGPMADVAAPEPEELDGDMSDEEDDDGGGGGFEQGTGGLESMHGMPMGGMPDGFMAAIPEQSGMCDEGGPPSLTPMPSVQQDGWNMVTRSGRKTRS